MHVHSLQSCGNGIVEEGEDCDPGSATDSCCDASTCKFASGAVCSTLNSLCCTSSCQIASSGTVCRAAVDASCDKEEVCSGSSKDCPDDEYEPNGKSKLWSERSTWVSELQLTAPLTSQASRVALEVSPARLESAPVVTSSVPTLVAHSASRRPAQSRLYVFS